MAGGEPIPENPLIGSEDFPTVATQKPVISCAEPAQQSTESVPTENMTEDHQLEDSTVLVIPIEDQDAITNFWAMAGAMEDDTKTDLAVEITLPEPQEGESSGTATEPVAEPVTTETPAPEASLPTPPPEENTPEITPTEESQPEPEVQNTEVAQAPEAAEAEQAPTPAPDPPKFRNQVPFRKICPSCTACETTTRCYATACFACGDNFALMYEDEADNEELRALHTEEERPACNPGDESSAYCKSCLLDWFDNCISWPHRETLPKHEGQSVLHLVAPFVSDAYMQRLMNIQAYWDDKDKIFCPVPTCSSYIPRTKYTVMKEETVTRTVEKPAPEKVEETTAPETEERNAEATAEATVEATAETTPETEAELTATTTTEPAVNDATTEQQGAEATVEPNTTVESVAEANVEANVEGNAETPAEPSNEEKKEEEAVAEKEFETITEIVKKEYKTRLAICLSPTCQTPVCTLCKSHFHGLDTPCQPRTDFFKEFMLAKFAKGAEIKEGEEGEDAEKNQDGDDDDDEYDEDGEYEEYPNRFRQCVNCQNLVARHTGCDHMTCACGAAFCFYCGGEYGQYHSCLSDDDYKAGDGVGGIKITNEDGFFDAEGAAVVVNPLGVIDKEEEEVNVAKWLDVVEFTENEEVKQTWKIKTGVEIEGLNEAEPIFSEDEKARLAKPMKDWKGKYY